MRSHHKDRGVEDQVNVWHLCKTIKLMLTTKAKEKECQELGHWIKSVTNHFWWSLRTCEGNALVLKENWISQVHHVADKHNFIAQLHS